MKTRTVKIWEVVFNTSVATSYYAAETFDELLEIVNSIRGHRDILSITYKMSAIQCIASE